MSYPEPQSSNPLLVPWIIAGAILLTLIVIVGVCQSGLLVPEPMPPETREILRTVLYGIAIVTFPMTNLIRHIQLRLNQTMPRTLPDVHSEAKKRYLVTVVVSLSMIESVGIYGLVLFCLGDGFNTLYILTGLSALGVFLYRPKISEYQQVLEALATQRHG